MRPTISNPLSRAVAAAIREHQLRTAIARIMRAFPGTTVEEPRS